VLGFGDWVDCDTPRADKALSGGIIRGYALSGL